MNTIEYDIVKEEAAVKKAVKVNKVGLNAEKSAVIVNALNELVANYQVFYMNVRGFHWNIKGERFFEFHAKFEELYTDLAEKIDEVAERVLTLGGTPMHSFEDYIKNAKVQVVKNVSDTTNSVSSIVNSFETVLVKQREILDASADANDEGTNALMSDYITEQEKQVWMYSAFLGQ